MEKHILKQEDSKVEVHVLIKEDFIDIFKDIIFFKNIKNSILEIGYVEYNTVKCIEIYLYNGEICSLNGFIFMNALKKIEILLNKLHIKDLD